MTLINVQRSESEVDKLTLVAAVPRVIAVVIAEFELTNC
jgi:hypothetical protein